MQMLEIIDDKILPPPASPVESQPESEAHRMRALRRKARRISAYARWSVTALNSLAVQVESDIAALQH